jgi:threonine dehydrogenase-like Zn-dependent dehydrogenase
MKALSLDAPKVWKRIDIPPPERPGPGLALVRVHRVGICGTDISGYLGKMPFFSYPRIPGHELGVEVLAVGEGVSNVKPGDRCSVEPYINDPSSYASRRGKPNCCEKLEVLGVHRDGGLRPEFILPARKLHVSTKLAFEQLALVETLAIGCHAVARAMSNAFGFVAHGGKLVFVGITTDEVKFRHVVFHKPEGTLLCSRNALPADFVRIIKLIEDGRIDTRPWITHKSAFDELPEVFPSYTRPETGVIKAVVEVT